MESIVLFVSPYLEDAGTLREILEQVSIAVVHAISLNEALCKIETIPFSVVLTEARLDDGSWHDLLRPARRKGSEVVVTDAFADPRFWAEAINLGAYDVLAQPYQRTEVQRVLASASSGKMKGRAAAGL
jgi:DNA-binding NtrC family response regulator